MKIGFVSLFTREWIEIGTATLSASKTFVSLFTREWIEIFVKLLYKVKAFGLPLYEGVD